MDRKEHKKSLLTNIVIIFGILLVVNLIAVTMFLRLDFSRGRIYSLSRSSKETVRELDDRLMVRAYFSRDLPAQLADANRYTRDILSEYQAHSRGRIRFEFVDPTDDERLQREAQQYGIHPVQMRVPERDRLEIRNIFMGLVFMYQGERETIPFVRDTRGLEYDITKNIKKLTDIGRRTVGFFKDEDDAPPPPQQQQQMSQPRNVTFNSVGEMMSDHYNVEEIDLMEEVPAHIDVMVFAGIQDSLHIEKKYNLDQFLMRGGNLLLFQNRIAADLHSLTAEPIGSNLFDLLHHYGIHIKENLVTDAECGQIQVQRQQGIFSYATPVEYPFLPLINNMNEDHPIAKNLENLQLLYASEIDRPLPGADLEMIPLFFTSEHSGSVQAPNLDISFERFMGRRNLRSMLTEPHKVVGALFRGNLETYYLDMFPDEDDRLAERFHYRTSDAEIVIVADTEFIQDGAGGEAQPNLDFVLNAIDYLMGDTALIEIRSRGTEFKPLREIGSTAKMMVRWANILLPTFLVIIFGIYNWRRQINRRKMISKIYEED